MEAIRAARAITSSKSRYFSRSSSTKSTFDASSIAAVIRRHDVANLRWSSSSSESSISPESPPSSKTARKVDKKMTDRLSAVIDAVNDRKLPPELRGQRNAVRSETDITNVVEHRIWQSMEEGQFENLPGKGKPLDLKVNPHADPAEDILYRILSKNGCAPEWVELNKQIRNEIAEWRSALKEACKLSENNDKWRVLSEALKSNMRAINDKVRREDLEMSFAITLLYPLVAK